MRPLTKNEFSIFKDALFIGLVSAGAYYYHNKWVLIAGCLLWAATQLLKPVRIFYFVALFYPFAYVSFAEHDLGGFTLNMGNILLTLLMVFTFLKWLVSESVFEGRPRNPRSRAVQLNVLLVLIFSAAVLLTSILHGEDVSYWVTSAGYALAFTAPVLLVDGPEVFSNLIGLFEIAAVVVAASAILSAFGIVSLENLHMKPSVYRHFLGAKYASTGLVEARGGFGINMAFVLPFIYLSIADKLKAMRTAPAGNAPRVAVYLALLSVLIFGIIISGSRATWGMFAVVTVLFFTLNYLARDLKSFLGLFIGAVLPAVIAVSVMLGNTIASLFEGLYNIGRLSANQRIWVDRDALNCIAQNPFFGVSHAQSGDLGWLNEEIHNFFLAIAATNGIAGALPVALVFICTFLMISSTWTTASGRLKKEAACLVAGFSGMMCNLMLYGGGEKQIWMYLGLMNSFYFISRRQSPSRI